MDWFTLLEYINKFCLFVFILFFSFYWNNLGRFYILYKKCISYAFNGVEFSSKLVNYGNGAFDKICSRQCQVLCCVVTGDKTLCCYDLLKTMVSWSPGFHDPLDQPSHVSTLICFPPQWGFWFSFAAKMWSHGTHVWVLRMNKIKR